MNSMGGYAVLALYLLLTLLTSKSYATKVYYYDECTSLLENRVVNDSRPVNVYKYYTLRGSTDQYEVQLMRHGDRINQEINGCFMRYDFFCSTQALDGLGPPDPEACCWSGKK